MALDAPPTDDGFALPTRLGRYRILAPLGSGGMAMVLLARAEGIGGFERDVAIKVIHPHLMGDEDLVRQFLTEARVAARIRHPNVVPVLDVGRHAQGVHLVMEYVEGDSLSGLVRRAARAGEELAPAIWMRVLADALLGLHAAHELTGEAGEPLGVVHRDFTPHNILVGTDGIARLCDFGVVKVVASSDRTATGIVKGKLRYLAPEQVRARALDRRCDVWAAGVTAWEQLAGQPLYDQKDQVDLLLSIAVDQPPRLRSVRPDIPPPIDDAVAWALTVDRDHRCPSAAALRERLLEAWKATGGVLASPDEVARSVRRLCAGRIEELREKIERFQRLRDEMGSLVAPMESDPTPSHLSPSLRRGLAAPEPTDAATLPVVESATATAATVRNPGKENEAAGDRDETTTQAMLPPTVREPAVGGRGASEPTRTTLSGLAEASGPSHVGASSQARAPSTVASGPADAGGAPGVGAGSSDPHASSHGRASSTVAAATEPSAALAAAPGMPAVGRSIPLVPEAGRRQGRGSLAAAGVVLLLGLAAWGGFELAEPPSLERAHALRAETAGPSKWKESKGDPTSSATAPTPILLTVVADAPIASLRVDEVAVPIDSPSKRISVPIDRPEGSTVTMIARAADGRTVRQQSVVRAGDLRLRFPPRAGTGRVKSAPRSPYE